MTESKNIQKVKRKAPSGKKHGLPKGHKKSEAHAEKLREAGKKGGRPRRRVIYQGRILEPGERVELPQPDMLLEELLFFIRVQGTEEEIAGHYMVAVETLNSRIKEHFGIGFCDLKKQVAAGGKLGLRVSQYNQSKKNTHMSKHLGEQWLNQKSNDKVSVNVDLSQKAILKVPDNGRRIVNKNDKKIDN